MIGAGTLTLLIGLFGQVQTAGSIYLNQPTLFSGNEAAAGRTVRGMNAEATFKAVVDVSDHVSANVKVCYGCHGFMSDMIYTDWNIDDTFNVRAGRFPVPFGEFYLRHDPANHKSATKPLPYSMGRMLRRTNFNLGVLPQPYPDNGIELFGTARGEMTELNYSAYAVAGLKGSPASGDLDFIRSRTEYFADNNQTPAVGGRVSLAFTDLPGSHWRWFAVGLSGMYGHYDDAGELFYALAGADLYTRVGKVNLRGEVMMRRTAIPDEPDAYQQTLVDLWHQREGFYVQLDGPITKAWEWLARVDGFRRSGPLRIGALLDDPEASIMRYTAGLNVTATRGFKFKFNYELWDFSSFETEHILHTGIVGTY